MSELIQGHLVEVLTVPQGGITTGPIVDGLLPVANSGDFLRDGGTMTIEGVLDPDGNPQVFTYDGVVEGEDDEPDRLAVSFPDPVLGGIQEDVRLDIYPPAHDVVAEVSVEDSDTTLLAVIPHSLRPLLVDGIRAEGHEESVLLARVGGQLQVHDVVGVLPPFTAETLDAALDDLHRRLTESALELAQAKEEQEERAASAAKDLADATRDLSRVTYSQQAPDDASGAVGDTWWQQDADGNAVAMWHRTASGWVQQGLDGAVLIANSVSADKLVTNELLAHKVVALMATFQDLFANSITAGMINANEVLAQKLQAVLATFQTVFAGTITADMVNLDTLRGKSLNGANIYSPDQGATPRVEIVGSSMRTVRTNSDGQEVTGVSLGGSDADRLQLLRPDGTPLAGFDEQGNGTATAINVTGTVDATRGDFDKLSINGADFGSYLTPLSQGVIARQQLGTTASGNGVRFGSGWLGYYELFYASPGRTTRVTYHGLAFCSAAGTYNFRLMSTSTPNPDAIPASSKADGSLGSIQDQVTIQASASGYYPIHLEAWYAPYGGARRVLLTAQTPTSGAYGQIYSADNAMAMFYAEDMGVYRDINDGGYNRGGGTVYAGSPAPAEAAPVVQKKTYTSMWYASEVATFRAGVGSISTATYKLQQGIWDSKRRWSIAVFGGGADSGETGKTIAAALSGATVTKIEFYGLVVETYASTGGTASLAPSGITDSANGLNANTATNEVRVGSWKPNTAKWVTLANVGAGVRSVLIGPDTNSLDEYIKFDPALAKLQLRITYTK